MKGRLYRPRSSTNARNFTSWSVAIISNGLFSNHDRKPAYLDDRYGALRQVEKLQAQARGATVAPPASTAGHP